MENDVFSVLVRKVLGACESSLLGAKNFEYTRQKDRFHNFKSAGKKRNKHPIDILLGYQIKHRVSIEDICEDAMNGIYPTDNHLLEKLKDHINYDIILFGMITELRQEARMDAMAEEEEIQTITADELNQLNQSHHHANCIPVGCYGSRPSRRFSGPRDQKEDSNPLLDVAYQRDNGLHETINKVNKSGTGLNVDKQTGDI